MGRPSFLSGLDYRAARIAVLIVLAIVAVSTIFWVSAQSLGLQSDGSVGQLLRSLSNSWWALPATALVFVLASFVGAPQVVLIAMTVAAFGPAKGFLFAHLATLCSASTNFALARRFGAEWFQRRDFAQLQGLLDQVDRNGFLAAMIVRIVPSAPFVVVNGALGLTRIEYLSFLAGTAIGIIPKLALISLLGKVVERAIAGDAISILYLALAGIVWIGAALLARQWFRR